MPTMRRWIWRARPPVLALGGGGARGFAHVGVFEVLDRLRLPLHSVVGTSMGAVVGAMYLVHGSAEEVRRLWQEAIERELIPSVRPMRSVPIEGGRENPLIQVARKIRNRVVVSFAMNRRTLLDDEALREALEFLVPDVEIGDMVPPFMAVATDIATGEEVHLRDGSLHAVLRASGAIPGLLPAVTIGGRQMVDGGVVAEVPVLAAHSLGRRVVAVDVSMDLPPLAEDRLVLDTMMRSQMITSRLLRERHLGRCRTIIRPPVGTTTWSEWSRFDELVVAGRTAAEEYFGVEPEVSSRGAEPGAEPGDGNGDGNGDGQE